MIARYSRPAMARVWSDEGKLETWLEVELAALDAWAELGWSRPTRRGIRAARRRPRRGVAELERDDDHDVAAFVDAVAESSATRGAGSTTG